MSAHTAGPWQLTRWTAPDAYGWTVRLGEEPTRFEIYADSAESEGNACLITAAPDLFAVLVELCEGGNSSVCVEGGNDWWVRVHAAIAKARGELGKGAA